MAIDLSWDDTTDQKMIRGTMHETFDSTEHPAYESWKNMYRAEKTDQYKVFMARYAGLEHGGVVAEGANIPTYDPKMGEEISSTQVRYGSGFTITDMGKRFYKQIDPFKKMSKDLKKTQLEMKDIEVFKLWNDPLNGTYTNTGYDGLALLANAHTCLDDSSTTYDNYVTTDLTTGSYEEAKIYFRTIVDDQGYLNPKKMDTLVVPVQLETTAQQLMRSSNIPWEQSNTINTYKGMTDIFCAERLTDDDAWFCLKKNDDDYGPYVKTSQEPDMKIQDAADTSRNTWVTSQQIFDYGFLDARLIYGSVPA